MTPDVSLTIRDPGLGIIPANAGRTQVKAGVCSKATPNTLLPFGGPNPAKAALGSGPLLDCLVQTLDVAGGPVLALPILPPTGSYGTVTSTFAQTGTGAGTVTGSKGPADAISVKIILGGALGTMTFQVKIGSGNYGPTVTSVNSPPWNYQIPGAYFSTIQFAAGTYVANDVYVIGTDGAVTLTGTGPATALNNSLHSPVDAASIWVLISTAGALGVATFAFSLDGGNHFSASILVPASGKYVIPGSGILLTFASTFVAGDLYKGTATAAGYTTTELNTALTALLALPNQWGWVHVIGQASSAAGANSIAATADAQMTAAQTAFRYGFVIIECPQAEGDSTIGTAFVSFQSARVGVVVGDIDLQSRLTGRTDRRSFAWAFTARLGGLKLSTDPARFDLGAVKNVTALYRDEAATPGLDDQRFITARTFVDVPGFYVNNFKLMAAPGSDFTYGMNRRVMDRACSLARLGFLKFINADTRIDLTTGFIDERDAQKVDQLVTADLESGLLDTQEVSSVAASLSRTDNLLSTSTVSADVGIVPKGYLKQINATIGFTNPVLQAKAA